MKRFALFPIALCFSPLLWANAFSETFQGATKVNLNLYLFAADVSGQIGQGNLQYDVDQPFKETLKNLDDSFMAHLDISKGQWGVYVDRQIVKTSQQQHVMQVPVALGTELNQSSYGVYYQAYRSPESTQKNRAKLVIEPTIGMHHTKADATLAVMQYQTDVSKSWDEFFWGSRFRYNFDSPWNLAGEFSVGTENTISAQGYVGYRIPVFKRDVNLRAGYRYFEQDYRSGNFHWDIKQHGPVIGINLPIF
ncbi:hypothetical protein BFG52_14675 [Acinetobacter larvae]|uniref:Uncharacterized protein n=1 Tax=Acinetobacter larvae TaxID=1789224 RepID=A0A1B2M4G9_9GAMM|nr:hypothetical protein BFG52_14675 [Acinetobacter larvae]